MDDLHARIAALEADAAVMREALRIVLDIALPTLRDNPLMFSAWQIGKHALSKDAGRELLADLRDLREYKAIADAAGTGRLIQERDAAERKVAAAEGMAAALDLCASLPIAKSYPDGPCIDREDHKVVIAALTAWQEASRG